MNEFKQVVKDGEVVKSANQVMRDYVKEVLTSKNIQKLPRTLASKMDDFASAEFFGLTEKMNKYGDSIVKFCEQLKARDFNSLPESVKSDTLAEDVLKSKALIHARKIRDLANLRIQLANKEAEVNQSLGKIPFAQREDFNGLLVELQNVIASEVE